MIISLSFVLLHYLLNVNNTSEPQPLLIVVASSLKRANRIIFIPFLVLKFEVVKIQKKIEILLRSVFCSFIFSENFRLGKEIVFIFIFFIYSQENFIANC